MSSFEEFLKMVIKRRATWEINTPNTCGDAVGDVIQVKDLGEWAWEKLQPKVKRLLNYIEEQKNYYENHKKDYPNLKQWVEQAENDWKQFCEGTFLGNTKCFDFYVYRNIAVGCLGKKEVEKRLKELEKK